MSLAEPIGAHFFLDRTVVPDTGSRSPGSGWWPGSAPSRPVSAMHVWLGRRWAAETWPSSSTRSRLRSPPRCFLRNLVGSIDRSRLRIPRDPAESQELFCDDE